MQIFDRHMFEQTNIQIESDWFSYIFHKSSVRKKWFDQFDPAKNQRQVFKKVRNDLK